MTSLTVPTKTIKEILKSISNRVQIWSWDDCSSLSSRRQFKISQRWRSSGEQMVGERWWKPKTSKLLLIRYHLNMSTTYGQNRAMCFRFAATIPCIESCLRWEQFSASSSYSIMQNASSPSVIICQESSVFKFIKEYVNCGAFWMPNCGL